VGNAGRFNLEELDVASQGSGAENAKHKKLVPSLAGRLSTVTARPIRRTRSRPLWSPKANGTLSPRPSGTPGETGWQPYDNALAPVPQTRVSQSLRAPPRNLFFQSIVERTLSLPRRDSSRRSWLQPCRAPGIQSWLPQDLSAFTRGPNLFFTAPQGRQIVHSQGRLAPFAAVAIPLSQILQIFLGDSLSMPYRQSAAFLHSVFRARQLS
jgi:hypothetical protein